VRNIKKAFALISVIIASVATSSAKSSAAAIPTTRITIQSTVTAVFGSAPGIAVNDTITFEASIYGAPSVVNSPSGERSVHCYMNVQNCTVQQWTFADSKWVAIYRRGQEIVRTESGTLSSLLATYVPVSMSPPSPERASFFFLDEDDDSVLQQNGDLLTNANGNFSQFASQLHQSARFDTSFFDGSYPAWNTYHYDYTRAQAHALMSVDTFQSGDVTYDVNSGSGTFASQRGAVNSTVSISSTLPTRSGYSFAGWNTTRNGSGVSYQPGASVTIPGEGLVVLHAQWTPIVAAPVAVPAPVAAESLISAPANARYVAGNSRVTVKWGAVAGASSYVVSRANGTVMCSTTLTSCGINRVRNGKLASYFVRSVNSVGTTSTSAREVKTIPGFVLRKTAFLPRETPLLSSIVSPVSKGDKTWRIQSGSCRISSGRLILPSKKGSCRLRLSVARRGLYPAMSTSIAISIAR
jgi:uncharacterized repeat protein (TIGR02543 family)